MTVGFAVILAGCSSHHASEVRAVPLRIVDRASHDIVALDSNDSLLDAHGVVFGRVVWATPEIIVGPTHIPLRFDNESSGIALHTELGTWHVRLAGQELVVADRPIGKLEGFTTSSEDWRRVGALVIGYMTVPTSDKAQDAGVSGDAAAAIPPPPQ